MNLNSSVGKLPLVGPIYQRRLEKLGIKTIENLLLYAPHRYLDFSITSDIGRAQIGETLTLKGEVIFLKNQYTRYGRKLQIGEVADSTGKITVVWFNQPYLVRTLYPGEKISLAGKVSWFGRRRSLMSPEYEKYVDGKPTLHTGGIIPVYHETSGISSKWLRGRIKEAFSQARNDIDDFLPEQILKKFHFINLNKAIESLHFPKNLEDSEKGRKRLAFDELLFLQLKTIWKKLDWQKNKPAYKLKVDEAAIERFLKSLPFELTNSQKKSITEITYDLEKEYPMNRLLEGDVGSGKTVVSAIAAFIAFTNGYQTIFMAPTQILAEQHFNTLNRMFEQFKVRISLVTSEIKREDLGRNDIFIGTHALIHRKVIFDKVAVVVIDEQHRFGVEQRAHLVRKSGKRSTSPHVLTMTATPIPRTVALTFYGDLDLSTLDELPKGRQKITTWVVPFKKRGAAYNWIKEKINNEKIQVFVICPLIEESQVETMQTVKAATKEYENLKKIFKNLKVGLLYGKQKPEKKNQTLDEFREGKINILVSTPVVEVGIDVPNATIMLVEGAERFGLAGLHQLRGRVGRGEKKSYCLLFTESKSQMVQTRLIAMTKSMSGFELAELDLKLRGPGEMFGTKQHGFPELKIAKWDDLELLRSSKQVAEDIFKNPKKYQVILQNLQRSQA